jgi:asparagine synthetase B (glutamine-hydrolysing)
MCGITGYWGYARADLAPDTFEAFTHSLAHRGPDDFAIEHWPDARLWLGHRRLAIINLSDRARQPLSYGNGRYCRTMVIEAAKVNGESHSTERCHFGSKKYHHHYT